MRSAPSAAATADCGPGHAVCGPDRSAAVGCPVPAGTALPPAAAPTRAAVAPRPAFRSGDRKAGQIAYGEYRWAHCPKATAEPLARRRVSLGIAGARMLASAGSSNITCIKINFVLDDEGE